MNLGKAAPQSAPFVPGRGVEPLLDLEAHGSGALGRGGKGRGQK